MKQFKDSMGREWKLNITTGTVKELDELLDIKVNALAAEDNLYESLTLDPVRLCQILYVICDRQMKELGISLEDFMEAIAGDAIEEAAEALVLAMIDFFPKARRRALLKAMELSRRVVDRMLQKVEKNLDDPDLEKKLDAEIDQVFSKFAADSQQAQG